MAVVTLPDLSKVQRLLIIRLSAIGDVVHALPVASALGEAYPHLEITWLVEEIPAEMVMGNPYVKEVIVIPRSRWKKGRLTSLRIWREYAAFLSALRRRRFDVTLDLQGYGKSALMALATGASYRLGWWRLRDGSNLVSHALPRRPESVHRVDWFLDTVRALGISDPAIRFPLQIPEEARAKIRQRLCDHGLSSDRPYIVINQAAGNIPRLWGRDRYGALALEIADRLRLPTVLIGTPPEAADCESIVAQVRTGISERRLTGVPEPLNLAGQTSLKELAALLDGCDLHVCGDTGSTHIAAALGRPVVALYGASDPAHAGPWGQTEHVLARRDLCHKECTVRQCAYAPGGRHEADFGSEPGVAAVAEENRPFFTARCLAAISVEETMAKVVQVLQETGVR